ncbi:MAG: hypothetical protein ACRDLN_10635 [Solirubrobacteraceae bacterium]
MTESAEPEQRPDVPSAPALPTLEAPPLEQVIESLPSKEEVVENVRSVDEIVGEQPSVDQLLGRDR